VSWMLWFNVLGGMFTADTTIAGWGGGAAGRDRLALSQLLRSGRVCRLLLWFGHGICGVDTLADGTARTSCHVTSCCTIFATWHHFTPFLPRRTIIPRPWLGASCWWRPLTSTHMRLHQYHSHEIPPTSTRTRFHQHPLAYDSTNIHRRCCTCPRSPWAPCGLWRRVGGMLVRCYWD
jgi:hypothetical protein